VLYRLYFDGACEPNPGLGAWGCHILTPSGPVSGGDTLPGESTNNVAEYAALGNGLKKLIELGVSGSTVEVLGDSQLVVNQVNRVWQCKDDRLRACLGRVNELAKRLEGADNVLVFHWIPRHENGAADAQSVAAWEAATRRPFPAWRRLPPVRGFGDGGGAA